jgi:hypothetical protein
MARWTRSVAAVTAAVVLHVATPAFPQVNADSGEEPKPSIFKSLWSGIKKTANKIAPGQADPVAEPEPDEVPGAAAEPEAAATKPTSLSNARWIGFTPALVVGEAAGEGAWIAGPFVEAGATGWVADTASGLSAEVRLVWREAAPGSLAELSAEAGRALGLAPGAVANVTVYLAR